MNPNDQKMLDEIERQERWLASQPADIDPPDGLDRVKQRVRLSIDERWLTFQQDPSPWAQTLAATKLRVRQALQANLAQSAEPIHAEQLGQRIYRMVPLAAAAMLMMAVGISLWNAPQPSEQGTLSITGEMLTASAQNPDDEAAEWEAIEYELAILESELVESWEPTFEQMELQTLDQQIDELTDEIDQLDTAGTPAEQTKAKENIDVRAKPIFLS